MSRIRREIDALTGAFFGDERARFAHSHEGRNKKPLATIIRELGDATADLDDDSERPVFLLSAWWRSGSTFLQRLMLSSKEVPIWGEPFDRCNLIQLLAESLAPINGEWPPPSYILTDFSSEL
ncbi:hypothetical protein [Pseudohaliea sp.]|uniref:hypothetical protein n=1 Tax=Pseudohaliea sp. TaxID=2740289 RepID=UPI0032EC86FD